MKECRRCLVAKPLSEMKQDRRNGDGYSSYCKECHKAASAAWQKANPEKLNAGRRARYEQKKEQLNEARRASYDYERSRFGRIWALYRATREWYEETLAKQGGVCAICKKGQSEFKRAFSVDHDHACCPTTPACGKCNRGILCQHCNTALHSLEKHKGWAEEAMKYLGVNNDSKSV